MPEVYIKDDKTVLKLLPKLAEEIGLNESLILMQIKYWIDISDNEKEGKHWTYQSTSDIQEKSFSFWSRSTIQRAIKSLEEKALIEIANFNKKKYDKTRWFAINWKELNKLDSVIVQSKGDKTPPFHNDTGSSQNETTIPKTTTKTTSSTTEQSSIMQSLSSENPSELNANDLIKLFNHFMKTIANFERTTTNWGKEGKIMKRLAEEYMDGPEMAIDYLKWIARNKVDAFEHSKNSWNNAGMLNKFIDEYKNWKKEKEKSERLAEQIEAGAPEPDESAESMEDVRDRMS